jgi:hypothetical protein
MTASSREARLAAISTQRERFSRSIAAGDRDGVSDAILAELRLLLDDAWVRTLSASALAPGVLGAMVRSGRLSLEPLRECLDEDPRWSEGVAALIASLDDEQTSVLDASLSLASDAPARSALRTALLFAGRTPAGRAPVESLLSIGWSTAQVLLSDEALAEYASECYARRYSTEEQSLFGLSELSTMLSYVEPSPDRDASLRAIVRRIELILDERAPDDRGAEVLGALADLVRALVTLGELARADAVLQRLESSLAADNLDELELLFWASRPVLAAGTAEGRKAREMSLLALVPRECSVRLWRVALETVTYRSAALETRVAELLALHLSRVDRLEPIERAEVFADVALGARCFSPALVERYVEALARHVRGSSLSDMNARVMLDFARENSDAARSFVERTCAQRTIAWWEDPSAYARLPSSTLELVLDGALRAQGPRWPSATVDALRWASKDLSSASSRWIDALFGGAPLEQRAGRAIFALGRALLGLRETGRDAESSRVAARLAAGEFSSSPAFDRVWWELGATAQRAAWLARPARADRVGWLVPKSVIETLAGAECADRYARFVDQWVERTARACGAR